jgi:hypothetical protein
MIGIEFGSLAPEGFQAPPTGPQLRDSAFCVFQIYRYNSCGNNFDQEPGFLCDIMVGGGDIWGGHSAAPTSFASIFLLVISTKSLIHLDLFRRLRSARIGYGR